MGNGNQPQTPRTDYPGAEYFALAPGRHIALGPRLAITSPQVSGTVAGGANTQVLVDVLLLPTFVQSSGIYIVRSHVLFVPDGGGNQQIIGARLGLATATAFDIRLDVGLPLLTFASPIIPSIAIQENTFLAVGLDMPGFPYGSALHMQGILAVHNLNATVSSTFQVQVQVVYHAVDGFVQ